jgi:hypothetical protein
VDTGEDFITPEFLHILFFQQKNLVIFPYVDLKHLHALELFTVGYTPVDLESTALHNLRNILEFESNNSYSQAPSVYFIYNLDKEKVKELLSIEGIRCILNSNETISELGEQSNFIFFNKKSNMFLNFPETANNLDFEKHLISSASNKEILHDKVQRIKNVATQIFTEVNRNSFSHKLPRLLEDFDSKYWQKILDFTSRYYGVNLPPASEIKPHSYEHSSLSSRKDFKDFSEEYEFIVSLNRNLAKEFIQQLHEFRGKKVNPDYLELEELFSPLKLYNYLRNRHWKEGIPRSFLDKWQQMTISHYTLSDSDKIDLHHIFLKLGIPTVKPFTPPITSYPENIITQKKNFKFQTLLNKIPSIDRNWDGFKSWIYSQINKIEEFIDQLLFQEDQKDLLQLLYKDIDNLCNIIGKEPKTPRRPVNKPNEYLVVDITNILHEDKDLSGKLKVENILKVRNAVQELGYIPELIADANMRHYLDNPLIYDQLIQKGVVKDVPAGREADEFILAMAKSERCKFLTNDMYRDYREEFGREWIYENRLTCKFFNSSCIIR